ncbi:MAG TPA: type II toxin-antitoxin system RelE/ParE family toxin [Gammaproteobacteria bacterium]
MLLGWSPESLGDLDRLYAFLAAVNPVVAGKAVRELVMAAEVLREHPRMGEQLSRYDPREVRRLIVSRYELRYEVVGENLYILRLWNTRETR